jgi:hypothetical protein
MRASRNLTPLSQRFKRITHRYADTGSRLPTASRQRVLGPRDLQQDLRLLFVDREHTRKWCYKYHISSLAL